MFYQIFLSPQAKRKRVISNKHGTYELSHELPNDLRLSKDQNNLKISWNYNLVVSLPPKNKTLSILAKDSLKMEIELLP